MVKINGGSPMNPNQKKPSFFKVIKPGHSDEQMRIPPQFLKHISEEFTTRATLKGPSGGNWDVRLERMKNGTYLRKGWQKFFKDHSLGDSELLIFQHDGNMCFNIRILDKGGCERLYTSVPKILEKYTDEKSQTELHLVKVEEENGTREVEEEEIMGLPSSGEDFHSPTRRSTAMALKAAESFNSELPYFKHTLREACMGKASVLEIPLSFSRMQLPSFDIRIVLRNAEGKAWTAISMYTQRGKHCICEGWPAFVHGNKLRVGHTCAFELVDRTELLVHIFR